ncbi:MAG: hypothetical protein JNK14_18965 [Chitinophagaceae bacterium]|nr:hypothetical protein [Chitinophagaceae bacterium]
MLKELPGYIAILFILTTIATLAMLHLAVRRSPAYAAKSTSILAGLLAWLLLQGVLSVNGIYKDTLSMPPKFLSAVLPPLVTMIILFATRSGRKFMDSLPLSTLTWLNIVRIPVEIGLYWLFIHETIPQLMTFEGRNFDIISGITAPLIAWLGFARNKLSPKVILAWNIICLLLVLNVVIHGVLSVPTPFQQFAFDQPNIAVLYFPFIWLPAFIVPVVIFTHLVSIRQLVSGKR